MKRILLYAILLSTCLYASCRNMSITEAKLPQQCKDYLHDNFGQFTYITIEKDWEEAHVIYEVKISSDSNIFDIDFHYNGTPIKVESQNKNVAIPMSCLPKKIATYLQERFPNNLPVEWKVEKYRQEVELQGDIEIEFDLDGNVLRVDGETGASPQAPQGNN